MVSTTRDAIGRISAIATTLNGVTTIVTSARGYSADGALNAQTWGNGELDEHQKKLIDDKRNQYNAYVKTAEKVAPGDFPESAQLCTKCSTKAVIKMDGCMTCLNCGDSKCG